MKKYLRVFILSVPLSMLLSFSKTYCQNIKRVPLQNIRIEEKKITGDSIAIALTADTAQLNNDSGLVFSIVLINNSKNNFLVKNPLDFLQINLTNFSGINISLRELPKALINSSNKSQIYQSFVVLDSKQNGKSIGIDFLKVDEINISPESTLEILMKIEYTLATSDGKLLPGSNKIKILSGNYNLGITISMMGKNIDSKIFKSEPIAIRLL